MTRNVWVWCLVLVCVNVVCAENEDLLRHQLENIVNKLERTIEHDNELVKAKVDDIETPALRSYPNDDDDEGMFDDEGVDGVDFDDDFDDEETNRSVRENLKEYDEKELDEIIDRSWEAADLKFEEKNNKRMERRGKIQKFIQKAFLKL